MGIAADLLRRAPKVLLHDHLDGGLRPDTLIELADEAGHRLPSTDPTTLDRWFSRRRGSGLPRYLEAFTHTVAVMQTSTALERVARECGEDLAADGVVYAEVRYAPELSRAAGLPLREVLEAIAAGFAAAPPTIMLRLLVSAMRQGSQAAEVFAAAARSRDLGVVGVDLAGPEQGFPASRHAEAISAARDSGLHVTLHAGEAVGPDSVADALVQGAERLGHGVRVVEDLAPDGTLGSVAREVLERGVPLELCPTSNVHTGAVPDLAEHPFERLRRLGFRVTVNTDNRLVSGVSATGELALVAELFGYDLGVLEQLTIQAADAAFLSPMEREGLVGAIRRGYAAL